jgi:hypothetical protein
MIRRQRASKHLAITRANSDLGTTGFRLDDEQCARVRDCLLKADLTLPGAAFERFVRNIEGSISRFLNIVPSATLRETHDALRAVWLLAGEDDPEVGVLRARINTLPETALQYINRRAPRVIPRLFPGETFEDVAFLAWAEPETHPKNPGFLAWAENADDDKLVKALRVLGAEGAQIVVGRSRGCGKRSARRVEPMILGEVRGTAAKKSKGGRPSNDARHELVMHLAMDWLQATGQRPGRGRSGETGFGDLVHSVFQWVLPAEDAAHETAVYELRRYWDAVNKIKATLRLRGFLMRHEEEP